MSRILVIAMVAALALSACGDGATSETSQDIDPGLPPTGTAPADWPEGSLDVTTADVVERPGEPRRVDLQVAGDLPNPCHIPVWDITEADGTITVDLRSASDPDLTCTQVLQPFDITIPLEAESAETELVVLEAPSGEYQFDLEFPGPTEP